jgi:predicted dehydrogenase
MAGLPAASTSKSFVGSAPVKIRRTLIGGARQMIVYDELEPTEKLRLYDRGVTYTPSTSEALEMRVGYRLGDMTAPLLATREPLANEAEHFIDCIETGAAPVTGGAMALRLINLLESATLSMRQRGRLIELDQAPD